MVDIGALPTQQITNTTLNEQVAQQDQNQAFQQNRYTPAQQSAQGAVLGGLQGLLSGQSAPQSMGLPQSTWDYATYMWQKNAEPQLAAQHGAGSPAMAGSLNELLMGLAAQSGQTAMANTLNAYNLAGDYAFRATGQDQGAQAESLTNRNLQQNTTQTGIDYGGLVGFLANTVGDIIGNGGQGGTGPNGGSGGGSPGGSGAGSPGTPGGQQQQGQVVNNSPTFAPTFAPQAPVYNNTFTPTFNPVFSPTITVSPSIANTQVQGQVLPPDPAQTSVSGRIVSPPADPGQPSDLNVLAWLQNRATDDAAQNQQRALAASATFGNPRGGGAAPPSLVDIPANASLAASVYDQNYFRQAGLDNDQAIRNAIASGQLNPEIGAGMLLNNAAQATANTQYAAAGSSIYAPQLQTNSAYSPISGSNSLGYSPIRNGVIGTNGNNVTSGYSPISGGVSTTTRFGAGYSPISGGGGGGYSIIAEPYLNSAGQVSMSGGTDSYGVGYGNGQNVQVPANKGIWAAGGYNVYDSSGVPVFGGPSTASWA